MVKLLTIVGLVISIFYGGMRYERADAKAEKYDNLAKATQNIVGYFQTLSEQTAQLNAIKDDTHSGDALTAAADLVWPPKKPNPNPASTAP